MGETIRFGVSLDSDLLDRFDALCHHHGYQNRSEALRDLIRKSLVEQEWEKSEESVVATLTLVYDHHKSDLAQKMTSQQHDAHHIIIASLHIHLDHNNCLEVLILQGNGVEVKDLSQKLTATKGVKYGNLSHATTGKNLS